MNIAILGWGSLIWNLNGLPVRGNWQHGGPVLPIEFTRISGDGRLTLVIDERHGVDVPTQFILSSRTDLEQAVNDLMVREGTSRERIGFLDRSAQRMHSSWAQKHLHSFQRIESWCESSGFDAVIWTALGPRFKDAGQADPFSPETAMRYINGLDEPRRAKAFEYIRRAPREVITPFRRMFDEQHGA